MTTFASKGPYQPLRRYSMGVRGILTIPASDSARNGWGKPFIDDNGDPIEPGTPNGADAESVLKEPKNDAGWNDKDKPGYISGNIDWRGPNGEILSWFGSPTRYFDFVPHALSADPGEIWPGQTTWQSPADPLNPTPLLSNLTGYFIIGRVSADGKAAAGGAPVKDIVYRKGKPFFQNPQPGAIAGAALKTLADGETWLYYIDSGSGGYVTTEILSRVKVPFDFDSPEIEQMDTISYGLTPHLLFGNLWNHANTSPFFFSESAHEAVAIRKRQVNVNTVLTPVAHLIRVTIAPDGSARFLDSGTCQTSKAKTTVPYYTRYIGRTHHTPPSEPAYYSDRYEAIQTCDTSYDGETIIAADWIGDTLVTATVSTSGSVVWNDVQAYELAFYEDSGLPHPGGFVDRPDGTFSDDLTEIVQFSGLLPNITLHRRRTDASSFDYGFSGTTTTYGPEILSQIKYLDLRYGILQLKQIGRDTGYTLEVNVDAIADKWIKEWLYVNGKIVSTFVDERDDNYLYHPADPFPGPQVYPPVYREETPPDPEAPLPAGEWLKNIFWVPIHSVPPYDVTHYTQPLDWLKIAFGLIAGVSPSGDNILVSMPIWPERDIDDLETGTWLDNRSFHTAMYGDDPLSVDQLKILTGSAGEYFRFHWSGTIGG